jgi:hypothetical protein
MNLFIAYSSASLLLIVGQNIVIGDVNIFGHLKHFAVLGLIMVSEETLCLVLIDTTMLDADQNLSHFSFEGKQIQDDEVVISIAPINHVYDPQRPMRISGGDDRSSIKPKSLMQVIFSLESLLNTAALDAQQSMTISVSAL